MHRELVIIIRRLILFVAFCLVITINPLFVSHADSSVSLQKPIVVSVTSENSSVTINWNPSGNPSGTKIEAICLSLNRLWREDESKGSITITGLTPGNNLSFMLRACYQAPNYYYSSDYVSGYNITVKRGYEVKYNTNGGTGVPSTQEKIPGSPLVLSSSIPYREGYTFIGWSTRPNATNATYVREDPYYEDKSVTLYAVWKKLNYLINYYANGGDNAPTAQTKEHNISLTLTNQKPTKSFVLSYNANGGAVAASSKKIECEFNCWNTKSDGSGTSYKSGGSYSINNGINLYAQWKDPKVGTLSTPTWNNHVFLGWYTSANGGTKITESTFLNKNMTVYAHWETVKIPEYTINYYANGGRNTPAAQTKEYDKTVSLTNKKPTKTYTLSYNVNGGTISVPSKNVECDFNCWNTKSDGSGTAYNSGGSYSANNNIDLYAQWKDPKVGSLPMPIWNNHKFMGWYTSASGGTKITESTIMTENMTVYAHWEVISVSNCLLTSDIFKFNNSSTHFGSDNYYISDNDFLKLSNYTREIYRNDTNTAERVVNSLQDARNRKWGGSCYGMSVVTILDKQNAIRFNETFEKNAATMSHVQSPAKNSAVKSAINYYQISQRIPYLKSTNNKKYWNTDSNWKAGLKQLVSVSKEGSPVLFSYNSRRANGEAYGHAIVIVGYKQQNNGDHAILVYDNRYPADNAYISIDSNYSTCTIVTSQKKENVHYINYVKDLSAFDSINILKRADNKKGVAKSLTKEVDSTTGYAVVTVKLKDRLDIENAEGKVLTVDNGNYSGNMEVTNETLIPNSTESGEDSSTMSFTVPDSDYFMVESESKGVDISVQDSSIYGSAVTNGADYVTISKKDGINVIGDRFSYKLSLSATSKLCDMVSISGNADNDVKLRKKGVNIEANGVDNKEGEVTIFSDTINIDDYSYIRGYDSILVTQSSDGENGAVSIMGSSDDNGYYDTDIGYQIEENNSSGKNSNGANQNLKDDGQKTDGALTKNNKNNQPESQKIISQSNKFRQKNTVVSDNGGAAAETTTTSVTVPKTSISKLKAGKKSLTVRWKKVSGVAGYQIQYSQNKKFSKGNKRVNVAASKRANLKVKKLRSKKRYYVHVRAYRKVGGKTFFSKWSKTKSVRVK